MTPPLVEGALTAPAVARNREPILAVLRRVLPAQGTVLEIASGTGEHAVHFAAGAAAPDLAADRPRSRCAARASSAHRAAAQLPNLLPPLVLDAAAPVWPVTRADAVVAINMIHISPWRSTEGLMAGAARVLAAGASLYLYGPFKEDDRHTAPSNAAFDASLRAQQSGMGRARPRRGRRPRPLAWLRSRRAHRDAGQQSESRLPTPNGRGS